MYKMSMESDYLYTHCIYVVLEDCGQYILYVRVIPSQFNNFFHMTISELDET